MTSVQRLELDRVAGGDILQPSEKPIAMTGDPTIRARECGVIDVFHGAIEDEIVGARQHRTSS
jgi:hypothetical protein